MYDRILELAAKGKITDARVFHPKVDARAPEIGISYGKSLLADLPHMVPFEISNVAKFLNAELDKKPEGINFEDTFKGELMRLPYDTCWLEFIAEDVPYQLGGSRVGAAASTHDDGLGFDLWPTLLLTYDGGQTYTLLGGDCAFKIQVDADGLYAGTMASAAFADLQQAEPKMGNYLTRWAVSALYAIYLLHWRKSVQVVHIAPTRQQKRQAQRDSTTPAIEYKTINISQWLKIYKRIVQQHGQQQQQAQQQGGAGTSFQQRLHTVRGHKKTWTEAEPQFGCTECMKGGQGHDGVKSHVGTFWIGPHHAGKKELGEIKHVYSVEGPG